jgi:glycosyltransferase involved in cell wall biosynthesis
MAFLYACVDVLMLHLRSDSLFTITVSHKVFTYLSAGKPVLVGGEGDVASLVTGAHAGIAVQPDNPEALASAVVKIHAMSTVEREAMGNNGRQVAC